MNSVDEQQVVGIINYFSESQDFFNQYSRVSDIRIYCFEPNSMAVKYGAIIGFSESDYLIDVVLSLKSFLNLKTYIDQQTKMIPTGQGLFSVLSNFYGVNIILTYVSMEEDGLYYTYIVMERDGRFFCTNVQISDIMCMRNSIILPVYFRKEIIDEKGITKKELDKHHFC